MKSNGSPRPTSPAPRVVVAFELTDTGESFHVAARNGVTTVLPGRSEHADATVRLPQRLWIELLLGLTSLGDALLADGVDAEGDLAGFVRFHRRFTTATAARAVGAAQTSDPHSEGETP
jgi:alkyl sulfatase BDS1-like metallo-beta-lactamase superfamily hydrolase